MNIAFVPRKRKKSIWLHDAIFMMENIILDSH